MSCATPRRVVRACGRREGGGNGDCHRALTENREQGGWLLRWSPVERSAATTWTIGRWIHIGWREGSGWDDRLLVGHARCTEHYHCRSAGPMYMRCRAVEVRQLGEGIDDGWRGEPIRVAFLQTWLLGRFAACRWRLPMACGEWQVRVRAGSS
jgi:hypothetical protein